MKNNTVNAINFLLSLSITILFIIFLIFKSTNITGIIGSSLTALLLVFYIIQYLMNYYGPIKLSGIGILVACVFIIASYFTYTFKEEEIEEKDKKNERLRTGSFVTALSVVILIFFTIKIFGPKNKNTNQTNVIST
jgi:uncharacterized membrane protein